MALIDAKEFLKPIGDSINKALSLIPDPNRAADIAREIEVKSIELESSIQSQITERSKNDMMSDSWLSKNIRPLALIFLTGWYLIVFVLSYFDLDPSHDLNNVLKELLIYAYQFYFGGRTLEKVGSMISTAIKKK